MKYMILIVMFLADPSEKMDSDKVETLYNYLTKKCKYSPEQVDNFFNAIDISIYSPLIQGPFRDY